MSDDFSAIRRRAPQGFWLSPYRTASGGGWFIPVKVHAEALMVAPDWFGLVKAPHGKAEVERAMADVIGHGWIRARRVSYAGRLHFHIHEPNIHTLSTIRDFLLAHPEGVEEIVLMLEWPKRKELEPIAYREFVDKRWPAWLERSPALRKSRTSGRRRGCGMRSPDPARRGAVRIRGPVDR